MKDGSQKLNTDNKVIEIIAEICRLMGDINRLNILFLCLESATSVNDIADKLDLSQSLVSHHLRQMKAARLVHANRKGKQIFYSVYDCHIRNILEDMYNHWHERDESMD